MLKVENLTKTFKKINAVENDLSKSTLEKLSVY